MAKKLILSVSIADAATHSGSNTVSFNAFLQTALERHRDAVVVWLAKHRNINAYTYEGGIDSWWGPGSVALVELGLKFSVSINAETPENSVEVIVEG